MDYQRILVALSLSHGRDAAFDRALSLAKASGADLYLLHAVPADHPFSRIAQPNDCGAWRDLASGLWPQP